MMDVIVNRRSIRVFDSTPVPEETAVQLLRAGFHANSAHHLRPWHFVLVDDPVLLQALRTTHANMSMLKTAPMAIIVCADAEQSPDFWPDDCAAATENILIAAQSMGLGSFWCAIYPRIERMESVGRLLGLPESIKPYSIIAIGTPAEEKKHIERYNARAVHRNIW